MEKEANREEMTRRFVNVEDHGDGAMFCTGIYNDFEKALGASMFDIYDFKNNYRKDGDFFEIGDLEELDGDGGLYIMVTFRSAAWNENLVHYYYILFQDDEEKGAE